MWSNDETTQMWLTWAGTASTADLVTTCASHASLTARDQAGRELARRFDFEPFTVV